jgi:hypothetical protein
LIERCALGGRTTSFEHRLLLAALAQLSARIIQEVSSKYSSPPFH